MVDVYANRPFCYLLINASSNSVSLVLLVALPKAKFYVLND